MSRQKRQTVAASPSVSSPAAERRRPNKALLIAAAGSLGVWIVFLLVLIGLS
jgi:hypothetical protein